MSEKPQPPLPADDDEARMDDEGSAVGHPEPGMSVPEQERDCLDEGAFRVSFPGPFHHHDVVVDGWRVPFLQAHLGGEDKILLTLDRRLAVELSTEEAERMVPFVADAISMALGFGAHPREDTERPLPQASYPRPERVVDVSF